MPNGWQTTSNLQAAGFSPLGFLSAHAPILNFFQ